MPPTQRRVQDSVFEGAVARRLETRKFISLPFSSLLFFPLSFLFLFLSGRPAFPGKVLDWQVAVDEF